MIVFTLNKNIDRTFNSQNDRTFNSQNDRVLNFEFMSGDRNFNRQSLINSDRTVKNQSYRYGKGLV